MKKLILLSVLTAFAVHCGAQDTIETKRHGSIEARNIRRDDGNKRLTYTITDESGKERDVTRSYREIWNFTERNGSDSTIYVRKGRNQWLPLPVGLLPVPPAQPNRFYVGVGYLIGYQPPYYFIEPDYWQTPSLMLGYTNYKWGNRGIGASFSYTQLRYKKKEVGENVNPRVIDTSGTIWIAETQNCFNIAPTYSQRVYFPLQNTFFNLDLSLGLWLDQRSEYEVKWIKQDPHIRCATIAEVTGKVQNKLHPGVSAAVVLGGETFFNWEQNWAISYSLGVMYPLATVVSVGVKFGKPKTPTSFSRQKSFKM